MIRSSSLLVAIVLSAGHATAGQSPWRGPEVTQVRLLSVGLNKDGMTIWAGLEFRMETGWKIYWRTPGPAGRPPVPDWSGSKGVEVGKLIWPRPQFFAFSGIETVGYGRRIVLPVKARFIRREKGSATGPSSLTVNLRYQTCKHICIPVQVRLSLTGNALLQLDAQAAKDVSAARAARPRSLPTAIARRTDGGKWRFMIPRPAGLKWRAPKLVLEAGTKSRIGLRPSKITSAGLVFDVERPPLPANRSNRRFLLVDGDWAGSGVILFR